MPTFLDQCLEESDGNTKLLGLLDQDRFVSFNRRVGNRLIHDERSLAYTG